MDTNLNVYPQSMFGAKKKKSYFFQSNFHFLQLKNSLYMEALPGVLGIQGEGLFIFRDLGRRAIYFQGFGEFLEF